MTEHVLVVTTGPNTSWRAGQANEITVGRCSCGDWSTWTASKHGRQIITEAHATHVLNTTGIEEES